MSNREDHAADKKNNEPSGHTSWRQRHGAMLLVAGFALVAILMAVIQKKMTQ